MSVAYVDTSVMLAIAFTEPGWEIQAARLAEFSEINSSNLLESEALSASAREGRTFPRQVLDRVQWVFPDRPLSAEIETALSAGGYLRGADLHHVATALYMAAGNPERMAFVTLDIGQGAVAAALGFRTEP